MFPSFIPTALVRATAIVLLLLAVSIPGASASAQQDAVSFAQKLGQSAITDLTDPKLSDSERVTRMRQLLADAFDVDAVTRFVLGPYARQTTPEQFQEMMRLYEIYVAHNYAGLFRRYNGEKVEFTRAQKQGDGDSVVQGVVRQSDGPPINVELRLRPANNAYKAVDLRIEGVSMPLTHRQQFASVINQRGGKVEGLLGALRDATQRFERQTPSQ